jgi:GntR family transcriptional regulator / MocR family aminotransferase
MPKTITSLDLSMFALQAGDGAPMHAQLYGQLRDAILDRRLKPGLRLPSTRSFATSLSVSRNTVLGAFDQLLAEGYIESRVGDGSYVSAHLPDDAQRSRYSAPSRRAHAEKPRVAARFEAVHGAPSGGSGPNIKARAFRTGVSVIDEFPVDLWARLYARRFRQHPIDLLAYGESAGYRPLRESIASYLGSTRSIPCHADQIIVTAASQEALMLISSVLLNATDDAWIEDPGYQGARSALLSACARVTPVPVDGDGLCVDAGIRQAPNARLVYVTPSVQYPTGATMSLSRRLALLQWATRADAWIIEDDYTSEHRFSGRPLSALYSLDRDQRVIYVGTFSKLLFGALRIGYIVLPERLIETFRAARDRYHLFVSAIEQAVLNDFIVEGHFARHVRRMRELYAHRRGNLLNALEQDCAGMFTVNDTQTGLHLTALLNDAIDDRAVSAAAAERGIEAQALSDYAMLPQPRGGLVLGYGVVSEKLTRVGTRVLRDAVLQVRRASHKSAA